MAPLPYIPIAPVTTARSAVNPLVREGEGEKRAFSGAMGKLLDLLSRTSSASATAASYALDDDSSTTIGKGIIEGITGRSKKSYSDVIAEQGVTNPIVKAVGGFVGDVALDPMTYLGIKSTKGTNLYEAAAQAGKARTDDVVAKAAEIMAADPARFKLQFAGKDIIKVKKPAILPKVADVVTGSPEDKRLLARAFSQSAEHPLGLADNLRVAESANQAKFTNHLEGIKQIYEKDLSVDERKALSYAIDSGQPISGAVIKKDAQFKDLGEYHRLTKTLLDDMFEQEVKAGLFSGELKKGMTVEKDGVAAYKEYNPNYVYRFFRKYPADLKPGEVKEFTVRAGGPNAEAFMKRRVKDVSLKEAKDLEWDPVDDIRDILTLRAQKHYRAMGRAQFVSDAMERFSVDKATAKLMSTKGLKFVNAEKSLITPLASRKFKDRYIPEFAAKSLNQAEATFKDATTGSEMLRTLDKVTGVYKKFNTAYSPGYHIRNTLGDAFLNAADGVTNPNDYAAAFRVLGDVSEVNKQRLLEIGGMAPEIENVPTHSRVKVNKRQLSSKEIWDLYSMSGAKSGFLNTEVSKHITKDDQARLIKNGNMFSDAVANFSDKREDVFRLTHFIKALREEAQQTGDLEKAAIAAGNRVRKFNIDYGGLSSFEKRTVNKVIPFYSWMRKATPLHLEMLFTKPGVMALYPKGIDMTQSLLNSDDGEGDYLIPEWVRESLPVRIALGKKEANSPLTALLRKAGIAKEGELLTLPAANLMTTDVLDPLARATDSLAQGDVIGAGRGLFKDYAVNPLTPLIKAPVEAGIGQSLYTGKKMEGAGDWGKWLASQMLPTRAFTGTMDRGPEALTGPLTGFPLRSITPQNQKSELESRLFDLQGLVSQDKEARIRSAYPNFDSLTPAQQESITRKVKSSADLSKTLKEARKLREELEKKING